MSGATSLEIDRDLNGETDLLSRALRNEKVLFPHSDDRLGSFISPSLRAAVCVSVLPDDDSYSSLASTSQNAWVKLRYKL